MVQSVVMVAVYLIWKQKAGKVNHILFFPIQGCLYETSDLRNLVVFSHSLITASPADGESFSVSVVV